MDDLTICLFKFDGETIKKKKKSFFRGTFIIVCVYLIMREDP